MLLSAVSVLVVAQSSSEIPEGLMNNPVLCRVKGEMNVLRTIKGRKVNWIGHIFYRNCHLKHVIEGKIEGRTEVTGR